MYSHLCDPSRVTVKSSQSRSQVFARSPSVFVTWSEVGASYQYTPKPTLLFSTEKKRYPNG